MDGREVVELTGACKSVANPNEDNVAEIGGEFIVTVADTGNSWTIIGEDIELDCTAVGLVVVFEAVNRAVTEYEDGTSESVEEDDRLTAFVTDELEVKVFELLV